VPPVDVVGERWSAYPPRLSVNADMPALTLSAKTRREQVPQKETYSITSSAAASSLSGTVRPSILAVWALMTRLVERQHSFPIATGKRESKLPVARVSSPPARRLCVEAMPSIPALCFDSSARPLFFPL